MRVLVTADLHFNHGKSKALAEEVIEEMNRIEADVLLVVGDTAVSDGDWIEQCLSRFRFDGPKLFVAGNHELWTTGTDSYRLFREEMPARVRTLGWHWLEGNALVCGDVAIVGSVGWYDYSFAQQELEIPRRFYQAKISPGAAQYLGGYEHLLRDGSDLSEKAKQVVARWNDGKFLKLGRSDESFLAELMEGLAAELEKVRGARSVIAAIHHLPFRELLPPSHNAQWDFAKAYLGAGCIGELLLEFENVKVVVCGHSHFPAEVVIGGLRAVNVGAGYRIKRYLVLEL